MNFTLQAALLNDSPANASTQIGISLLRMVFLYLNAVPGAIETILCAVVLISAVRAKISCSPPNLLVLASATSDMIRGLHSCFALILYDKPVERTHLNEAVCCAYRWFHVFQYATSCWLMVAIAYSRYDVIARPLSPRLTKRRVWIVIVASMFLSALFATFPLIGWNKYHLREMPSGAGYRCSSTDQNRSAAQRSFVLVNYGINSVVPMILVLVFLTRIVPYAVRSAQWNRKRKYSRRISTKAVNKIQIDRMDLVKSKAFRYAILIVVSNIVFSAPFLVVKILSDYFKLVSEDNFVCPTSKFIFSTGFVINSILYVFWARTFQTSLSCIFCFWRPRNGLNRTANSQSPLRVTGF